MRIDEPESRKYQKTDYYIDDFTERWLRLQRLFSKIPMKRKPQKPYEIRRGSSAAWIVARR